MKTDEALMEAAQSGDHASFAALHQRYNGQLIGQARMRGLQDVDDAVQDAWIRVWMNRARYDRRRRFAPWLYTVACRLYATVGKQAGRRAKRYVSAAALPEVAAAPVEAIDRDEAARAMALLPTLPERNSQAIRLLVLDGQTTRAAAPALGISAAALGMRKRAGLATLRRRIGA